MKTHAFVSSSSDSPLLDALYLIVAGAMFEAQTRGAVKPFGLKRRTLKTLALRHGK